MLVLLNICGSYVHVNHNNSLTLVILRNLPSLKSAVTLPLQFWLYLICTAYDILGLADPGNGELRNLISPLINSGVSM